MIGEASASLGKGGLRKKKKPALPLSQRKTGRHFAGFSFRPRARRRGEGPSVPLTPGSQRKEDSLEDVSPPETVAAAAFKYGGHSDASSGPPGTDEETEDVVPHAVGPVVGRGAKQPQSVPRTGAPLQMRVSGSTYSSDCALSKLCPQGLHDEEARRRVPAASVATAVVGD